MLICAVGVDWRGFPSCSPDQRLSGRGFFLSVERRACRRKALLTRPGFNEAAGDWTLRPRAGDPGLARTPAGVSLSSQVCVAPGSAAALAGRGRRPRAWHCCRIGAVPTFLPGSDHWRSPCAMLVARRHSAARTGAIHSDLAKRGRRVVQRRRSGVAPVSYLREAANPRTIHSAICLEG